MPATVQTLAAERAEAERRIAAAPARCLIRARRSTPTTWRVWSGRAWMR
jgi:hypothetical protein